MAEAAIERRETIRKLIRSRVVSTQEELGSLLASQGYEVTQATLSRDLARLGARRAARLEGGSAYELPDAPVAEGPEGLAAMHHLVTTIDEADALVLVRTLPGGASVVALAIDKARPEGVLGTIAGDDTIFLVPTRGTRPSRVAKSLRVIWKKGN
ncbi:MAG: arginine repressor [Archangiaceae bacterium]|nr:arginine repressor [Archangiaceae bacterium]